MRSNGQRGFTLIELAIVLLVMGIVIAFSVPAFMNFGKTNALKGAADNMASQIRLARQRAMSTGVDQHFHFANAYVGYSYLVHPWPTSSITYFTLPTGVHYTPASFATSFFIQKDGRASTSQTIKIVNARRDTAVVSVELSGLVTVY